MGLIKVYPPAHNTTYVKATTSAYGAAHLATDPARPSQYASDFWTFVNQRFHIDLGEAKTVKGFYYENGFLYYSYTGVKNFTLWGSNEASAFAELTYATDTNWTQITCSQSTFDVHAENGGAVDGKYITCTNTVAYRYYAFKFADCQGPTNWLISLCQVALQISDGIPESRPTGGTITQSGGYTIHTFNGSGTFVTQKAIEVDFLVVGGGGGGGGQYSESGGGSGGAGGYRCSVTGENSGRNSAPEAKLTLAPGNHTVTVGTGGAGAAQSGSGGQGGNSVLSTITSLGGGAGPRAGLNGVNGGSGSGSNGVAVGAGTSGQGTDGTASQVGGGAAAAPTGLSSSITGSAVTRAAGGNGPSGAATPGPANSGNGGMSAMWNGAGGGAGGSGVVIIRYRTSLFTNLFAFNG